MSGARRVVPGLATLALVAAVWSAASLSGGAGRCGVPAARAAGGDGCCHYNKGVCDCEGGRARCCDGKLSASCACTDKPLTRQITVDTQPLLGLADVAFASQESPEPPNHRLTLFRLGADALRFWFRLDCGDECWRRLAGNAPLPLEVRWFFDLGSVLVLDSVRTIALQRSRPSVFVPGPTDQLLQRQGYWVTEVRFDTERLCARGEKGCFFQIEVRR